VAHVCNADRLLVRNIDEPDFSLPHPLALPEKDVELWKVDLVVTSKAETRWREILSADERARADRFHFEKDRRHFSAARALLRIVLAAYSAATPEDIRFRYAEKGKPELADPFSSSGLTFNVSHSGSFALFAVTRHRAIGVDVEQMRKDFDGEAIARRFFSAREQEQFASLPREQQQRAFFRCWTLKEAFIKALGEGLSHPLHQFDVSLDRESPVSLTTRPNGVEAERWQLQVIEVGAEHAAALAVRNEVGD
jgi:4'-phosphopantetheinyl transferase